MRKDFHDKCYICELKNLQDPQVEHLLPHKNGKYPERKFDWNNLFLSCGHCNSVKNQKKYDEGIIDCCKVDPEKLLTFRINENAVEIEKKEEKEDKTALIACVGNGFRIGGGIRMCPKAVIDDGLLDFVIANKLKKSRIPLAFIKLMKGKILEQDFTTMERVDHVKIEFDKPSTVQIDGELYENLDFDLSLIKGGVKVYRP